MKKILFICGVVFIVVVVSVLALGFYFRSDKDKDRGSCTTQVLTQSSPLGDKGDIVTVCP